MLDLQKLAFGQTLSMKLKGMQIENEDKNSPKSSEKLPLGAFRVLNTVELARGWMYKWRHKFPHRWEWRLFILQDIGVLRYYKNCSGGNLQFKGEVDISTVRWLESIPEGENFPESEINSGTTLMFEATQPNKASRKRIWLLRCASVEMRESWSDAIEKLCREYAARHPNAATSSSSKPCSRECLQKLLWESTPERQDQSRHNPDPSEGGEAPTSLTAAARSEDEEGAEGVASDQTLARHSTHTEGIVLDPTCRYSEEAEVSRSARVSPGSTGSVRRYSLGLEETSGVGGFVPAMSRQYEAVNTTSTTATSTAAASSSHSRNHSRTSSFTSVSSSCWSEALDGGGGVVSLPHSPTKGLAGAGGPEQGGGLGYEPQGVPSNLHRRRSRVSSNMGLPTKLQAAWALPLEADKVVKCGWLLKKQDRHHSLNQTAKWQRRFFVIRTDFVVKYYAEDQNGTLVECGEFDVYGLQFIDGWEEFHQGAPCLMFEALQASKDRRRRFSLCASHDIGLADPLAEIREWRKALELEQQRSLDPAEKIQCRGHLLRMQSSLSGASVGGMTPPGSPRGSRRHYHRRNVSWGGSPSIVFPPEDIQSVGGQNTRFSQESEGAESFMGRRKKSGVSQSPLGRHVRTNSGGSEFSLFSEQQSPSASTHPPPTFPPSPTGAASQVHPRPFPPPPSSTALPPSAPLSAHQALIRRRLGHRRSVSTGEVPSVSGQYSQLDSVAEQVAPTGSFIGLIDDWSPKRHVRQSSSEEVFKLTAQYSLEGSGYSLACQQSLGTKFDKCGSDEQDSNACASNNAECASSKSAPSPNEC